MPLYELTGDATQFIQTERNEVLAHVVNDCGGWGRGFVRAVSNRWPQAETDYRRWARFGRHGMEAGPPFQLGEILISKLQCNLRIAHLLAQRGYRRPDNPRPISYEALVQCLRKLADFAASQESRIHMPRIGTGLGGGEWVQIREIIEREIGHLPVYIYTYR